MFDTIEIGQEYDRPRLARLWGIVGFQAISRGVYTPRGKGIIVLFVTHEKQEGLTQYEDFIQEDLLFWEGENGHRSDERIMAASKNGEEIHLFYRDRHHNPFIYHGRVIPRLHCLNKSPVRSSISGSSSALITVPTCSDA